MRSRFASAQPPTPQFYPLSLHDALPIYLQLAQIQISWVINSWPSLTALASERNYLVFISDTHNLKPGGDRKSTRLNSSHRCIAYAVFCLQKNRALLPGGPTARDRAERRR